MDEVVQIIPYYAHPHVFVVINDNTFYDEAVGTPVEADMPYGTAVAFGADSGRDNTWIRCNDLNKKRAIFGSANFADTINKSLNQCFSRTMVTSLTTLFVCVILAVMGGSSIRDFGLVQCFGILIGTYSSVCVCSPVVLWWSKRFKKGV